MTDAHGGPDRPRDPGARYYSDLHARPIFWGFPGMEARLVAGRYQLVRPLGRGGMGAVWLGEDQLAGRQVAVKELRPPDGVSPEERDVFLRRALSEARSAAQLTHPNAVTLHDVIPASAADDAVYLIMEYVAGASLGQLVDQQGPLSE